MGQVFITCADAHADDPPYIYRNFTISSVIWTRRRTPTSAVREEWTQEKKLPKDVVKYLEDLYEDMEEVRRRAGEKDRRRVRRIMIEIRRVTH